MKDAIKKQLERFTSQLPNHASRYTALTKTAGVVGGIALIATILARKGD